MQDRVPLYPGRVRLTPISGQTNVYDMTMEDSPSVVGTPLNKNTLLNALAEQAFAEAEMELTDATVSEALLNLASFSAIAEVVSYVGTGVYGASNPCQVTFAVKPDFIFLFAAVPSSGYVADVNGSTTYRTYNRRTVIPVSVLTNTYNSAHGLYENNSSDNSALGKYDDSTNTYSWYDTAAANKQWNSAGTTYYVLGIKGVR